MVLPARLLGSSAALLAPFSLLFPFPLFFSAASRFRSNSIATRASNATRSAPRRSAMAPASLLLLLLLLSLSPSGRALHRCWPGTVPGGFHTLQHGVRTSERKGTQEEGWFRLEGERGQHLQLSQEDPAHPFGARPLERQSPLPRCAVLTLLPSQAPTGTPTTTPAH
jgi:hypothetical protein